MSREDQGIPNLDGVLADATERLRQSPVSEYLIERCRANALSIADGNTTQLTSHTHWIAEWAIPMAAAALIVLAINCVQAYARMPPRDRQIAAIQSLPDGQRQRLYSDRVIEPILRTEVSEPRNN